MNWSDATSSEDEMDRPNFLNNLANNTDTINN